MLAFATPIGGQENIAAVNHPHLARILAGSSIIEGLADLLLLVVMSTSCHLASGWLGRASTSTGFAANGFVHQKMLSITPNNWVLEKSFSQGVTPPHRILPAAAEIQSMFSKSLLCAKEEGDD